MLLTNGTIWIRIVDEHHLNYKKQQCTYSVEQKVYGFVRAKSLKRTCSLIIAPYSCESQRYIVFCGLLSVLPVIRHIFTRFWRESVKPLQYYCHTLPISYFIDQGKLLFWKKLAMHNNNFLLPLSRLVQNWFYAIGSVYGITTISASVGQIESAVWAKFTETV